MTTVRRGEQHGFENLVFDRDNDPGPPGPGEVRVRIEASSLNPHDANVVLGRLRAEPGRILLADAAGVIEAVGADVLELSPGDRVISCFFPQWLGPEQTVDNFSTTPGDGVDGFARPVVVRPAHWFTRAPAHLSPEEAATLPTAGLTAWRALHVEGRLQAGETVLLLGTGGVSIFGLQLAKAAGARVIITSSSDEKLARARAMGADETINYRSTPEWGQAVRELTGGRGVDHVIETGGPGTLAQSISAVRIGGHISLIGVLTGLAGQISTGALIARQVKLQGILVGSPKHQQAMVEELERLKLHPIIDRTFELDRLAEAFTYEARGEHFGKLAVRIR